MTDERTLSRRALLARVGVSMVATPLIAGCTLLDAVDDDRFLIQISGRSRFDPSGITVPVGATVVWRNMDEVRHTVTTDLGVLDDPNRVRIPDGAESWDSGDILTGERWTHTFRTPGTYVYACRYHQSEGMVGTVTVEKA